jgi:hypothetical protein
MHGEEIGRIGHRRDQLQFVFDLCHDLFWHTCRIAPRQARLGQLPQPGIGRLAGGDHLLRILVAQFVQRKIAARGDLQRLRQQVRRIQASQGQARTQMALAVGKQRMAGLRHGGIEAQGGEHVLQRPPRARMHVHVAGGHQRQLHGRRQFAQVRQALVVVGPQVALAGDPGAPGEVLRQPARVTGIHFRRRQPQRQAIRHPATVPSRQVLARQQVAALLRTAPAQRD